MIGERPVAGLAPNAGVLAEVVNGPLVTMALRAPLLPSVADGSDPVFANGQAPIVAVAAKVAWHKGDSQGEKGSEAGAEEQGEHEEMLLVLQPTTKSHRHSPPHSCG
jgi:hypothetical protein